MKWTRHLIPGFARRFDHYLLIHYPNLWRTRLHYVFLICLVSSVLLYLWGRNTGTDVGAFLAFPNDYVNDETNWIYFPLISTSILGLIYWRKKLAEFKTVGRSIWAMILPTLSYVIGLFMVAYMLFALPAGFSHQICSSTEAKLNTHRDSLEKHNYTHLDDFVFYADPEQLRHPNHYFTECERLGRELALRTDGMPMSLAETIESAFLEYVGNSSSVFFNEFQAPSALNFPPLHAFLHAEIKEEIFPCGELAVVDCYRQRADSLVGLIEHFEPSYIDTLLNEYYSGVTSVKRSFSSLFYSYWRKTRGTYVLENQNDQDLINFSYDNVLLGLFSKMTADEMEAFMNQYGHLSVWSSYGKVLGDVRVEAILYFVHYSYAFYNSLNAEELQQYRAFRKALVEAMVSLPAVDRSLLSKEYRVSFSSKIDFTAPLKPIVGLDQQSWLLYRMMMHFYRITGNLNLDEFYANPQFINHGALQQEVTAFVQERFPQNTADSLYFQQLYLAQEYPERADDWVVSNFFNAWSRALYNYYQYRYPKALQTKFREVVQSLNLPQQVYKRQLSWFQPLSDLVEYDYSHYDELQNKGWATKLADSIAQVFPPSILTWEEQNILSQYHVFVENEKERRLTKLLALGAESEDWTYIVLICFLGLLVHFLSINSIRSTLVNILICVVILSAGLLAGEQVKFTNAQTLAFLPFAFGWLCVFGSLLFRSQQTFVLGRLRSLVAIYTSVILPLALGSMKLIIPFFAEPINLAKYMLPLSTVFYLLLYLLHHRYKSLPSRSS